MSFEARGDIPSFDSAALHELPERNFKDENRNAANHEKDEIGNKESAAAVFVAEIRKAPHIPKADDVAHHGENKLALMRPFNPRRLRLEIFIPYIQQIGRSKFFSFV